MKPDSPVPEMVQYCIYHHPADYPHGYVVREWHIFAGRAVAGPAVFVPHLEAARAAVPPGLVCIARSEEDDPCIVETWL